MSTNTDLKALWNQEQFQAPDPKEITEKVNKFKRSHLKKVILTNFLLIVTSIIIACIWYFYQPKLISTKIGIVLTVAAMLVYLFAYNQIVPLLLKSSPNYSMKAYLEELLHLKKKQLFLQSTMMSVYFVMLSSGILLYFFEYTSLMNLTGAVLMYSLTSSWIAFNWFYLKPRMQKKQQTKINGLINRVELLNEQLNIKD
jgi:cyclic lactone autoinducer peptide